MRWGPIDPSFMFTTLRLTLLWTCASPSSPP